MLQDKRYISMQSILYLNLSMRTYFWPVSSLSKASIQQGSVTWKGQNISMKQAQYPRGAITSHADLNSALWEGLKQAFALIQTQGSIVPLKQMSAMLLTNLSHNAQAYGCIYKAMKQHQKGKAVPCQHHFGYYDNHEPLRTWVYRHLLQTALCPAGSLTSWRSSCNHDCNQNDKELINQANQGYHLSLFVPLRILS